MARIQCKVGSKLTQTARHTRGWAWDYPGMFRRGLSARQESLNERVSAALARHEQMAEEHKIFIRDITRRNERIVQDLVRHGNESSVQNARDIAVIVDELKELTKESRAQREGLLAAIDRLPPTQRS